MISIIIPILNEATVITRTLPALQALRVEGQEVIIVDGGSTDGSIELSRPFSDKVIRCSPGRSRQMNQGSQIAKGEILLFLHADTFLPKGASRLIHSKIKQSRRNWGRFDVRLSGKGFLFRMIEFLINVRSRLTGIATGDQGIFVKRDLFEAIGGYPEIDLMEDVALSKSLKRYGHPLCLWPRVVTSSRRWEAHGILRTVVLMWFLRLVYFLGVHPRYLVKYYKTERAR